MAFPEDGVYQYQERSSPKLFTEYNLSAILTIVGLIGSCMPLIMYAFSIV